MNTSAPRTASSSTAAAAAGAPIGSRASARSGVSRSSAAALRSGMVCFGQVARSMGLAVPAEPDPEADISLSYDEFLGAVTRLDEVGFPIQREPEAAWPHFVGWRVNYERAAYAIAEAVDAVPALWSGPRRRPQEPIAPLRPGPGMPPL